LRLPKAIITALNLHSGSRLEIELTPKKDAIIIKAAAPARIRGRHRIEDLAAAMPKNYSAAEFGWKTQGREVW
jgi:antitoxin component of MazEF toxin-antitoxin module